MTRGNILDLGAIVMRLLLGEGVIDLIGCEDHLVLSMLCRSITVSSSRSISSIDPEDIAHAPSKVEPVVNRVKACGFSSPTMPLLI